MKLAEFHLSSQQIRRWDDGWRCVIVPTLEWETIQHLVTI
jgi:hypothetical protein